MNLDENASTRTTDHAHVVASDSITARGGAGQGLSKAEVFQDSHCGIQGFSRHEKVQIGHGPEGEVWIDGQCKIGPLQYDDPGSPAARFRHLSAEGVEDSA